MSRFEVDGTLRRYQEQPNVLRLRGRLQVRPYVQVPARCDLHSGLQVRCLTRRSLHLGRSSSVPDDLHRNKRTAPVERT